MKPGMTPQINPVDLQKIDMVKKAFDSSGKLQMLGLKGLRDIKNMLTDLQESPIFGQVSRSHIERALELASVIEWKYGYNEEMLEKYLRGKQLELIAGKPRMAQAKGTKAEVRLPGWLFILPTNLLQELENEFTRAVMKSRADIYERSLIIQPEDKRKLPLDRPTVVVEEGDHESQD